MTDEIPPHEKAKAWRRAKNYTIADISRLTGYSPSTISDIETGVIRGNHARPVPPGTMRRYRLCLAAIDAGLTDWDFS